MATRYVVLQFDDGGRFDYDPPLPHPADTFLEMFSELERFSGGVGATMAREVDESGLVIGEPIHPPVPPSFP